MVILKIFLRNHFWFIVPIHVIQKWWPLEFRLHTFSVLLSRPKLAAIKFTRIVANWSVTVLYYPLSFFHSFTHAHFLFIFYWAVRRYHIPYMTISVSRLSKQLNSFMQCRYVITIYIHLTWNWKTPFRSENPHWRAFCCGRKKPKYPFTTKQTIMLLK